MRQHLNSADISIFSLKISSFARNADKKIQKFEHISSNSFTFFKSLKAFFNKHVNILGILMMTAKLTTRGLLKRHVDIMCMTS